MEYAQIVLESLISAGESVDFMSANTMNVGIRRPQYSVEIGRSNSQRKANIVVDKPFKYMPEQIVKKPFMCHRKETCWFTCCEFQPALHFNDSHVLTKTHFYSFLDYGSYSEALYMFCEISGSNPESSKDAMSKTKIVLRTRHYLCFLKKLAAFTPR